MKDIVHLKSSHQKQSSDRPLPRALLSSPRSSTIVPLDLDDGELAGDCVWGQESGSLRPQCHSAPQCNQESQWLCPGSGGKGVRRWEQKPCLAGRGRCKVASEQPVRSPCAQAASRSWQKASRLPMLTRGRGEG